MFLPKGSLLFGKTTRCYRDRLLGSPPSFSNTCLPLGGKWAVILEGSCSQRVLPQPVEVLSAATGAVKLGSLFFYIQSIRVEGTPFRRAIGIVARLSVAALGWRGGISFWKTRLRAHRELFGLLNSNKMTSGPFVAAGNHRLT